MKEQSFGMLNKDFPISPFLKKTIADRQKQFKQVAPRSTFADA